jgi:hypothetical protein
MPSMFKEFSNFCFVLSVKSSISIVDSVMFKEEGRCWMRCQVQMLMKMPAS